MKDSIKIYKSARFTKVGKDNGVPNGVTDRINGFNSLF